MKIQKILLPTICCCLLACASVQAQCITLEASVSQVVCHDDSNGAIDITVTSGAGPFTYLWSNGADTEDITDLPAGLYIITVTDAFGCNVSLARTLNNPAPIVDSLGGFCSGNFAPMDLTCYVSGGVTPYEYQWSTGEQTPVIQVQAPPANYSVTVTDAYGCASYQSIFSGPPRAEVQNATLNIECTNPLIQLSGEGSQYDLNNVSIFWDSPGPEVANIVSGGNTLFPSVNGPGFYYLNIVDSVTFCSSFNVVVVTSTGPNAFIAANAGPDKTISCISGSAILNGNQSSSGPNIAFQWSTLDGNFVTGTGGAGAVVNSPGVYTLTVSNTANLCTASDDVQVFASNLPLADAGPDLGLPCGGGTVTLAAGNAGPNINYSWTGPGINLSNQFLLNPMVNTAGIYTLIVTDASTGCTATDQVQVFDGPIIAAQNITAYDLPCQPGALGGIDLTVNFGVGPYTYLWSNNATTEDLNNLPQGDYTVTVTDNGDCHFYGFATIGQGLNFVQTSFVTTDPGCILGAIDLTATNPTPPYFYAWSGPNNFSSTLEDPSGLNAGVYVVTITDATSCTVTASVTLNPGPAGATLSFSSTQVICGVEAAIDLTVSGGTSPYTYDWSNDGPDATDDDPEDLTDLSAGSYVVTVTDALGCETASVPVVITETPLMTLSAVITPSACGPLDNTGAIDLTVSGGRPPYQYAWGTGAATQDILMQPSGTYYLWVTDADNCTVDTFFVIPHGSTIPAGNFTIIPASCEAGSSDGAITLDNIPATAQAPYTFLWSGPAGFSASQQNISNLVEGAYTLSLTDGTGCTFSASLEVSRIPGDFILTTAITDAACNGGSDGTVDLTVSSGIGPFSFLWSNGVAQEDLSGVTSGTYTVTVTQSNGCAKTTSATVGQLNGVAATIAVTNVFCFNGNNGALTASGTGGQTPYTFLWNNNATTATISNLPAGNYTVTITDINGCSDAQTAQITQPTNISTTTNVTPVLCFGANTGAIDLTVNGGVPPYTYSWAGPQGFVAGTQDVSNLTSGNYVVTITDVNGCPKILMVQVPSAQPIAIPANNIQITNVRCNGGSDGAINITPIGGTPPYTYDWSNDGPEDPDNDPEDIGNLPAGTYTVTITDVNGCSVVIPGGFAISEPAALTVQINELSNTCDVAVLQASVAGGAGTYSFQWSGPNGFTSTVQQITAPASGVYALTVTDANGCTITGSKTVQLAGNGACGYIRGLVVHDILENCVVDNGEPGLGGWLVRAEGADTLYGITDQNGRYLVSVPAGDYTMAVIAPNNLWDVCPLNQTVSLINAGDTIQGGDFPVQSPFDCALLSVSIGTNQLRRCFSNNFYFVEYCNEGAAVAEDAYVVVTLDPFLNFQGASIPHLALGGNQYRFNVGDLDIGECGTFNLKVFVSCSAVLGQTHCTEARIYPDTLCNTNALWSGASLSLRSQCDVDSLRFVVKNIGGGNILGALDYIVVEDAVMRMSAPMPPLPPGDSVQISVPANGSTWRLEVDQELYHPYPDPVSLSVEGCTTSATFSTGYVNQFPLGDEAPASDEDCTANIGSYDPNDKHGYPIGYGAERFIRPGTDLEYLIRFQNTGTDTAFNIVVLDTLSAWLDPATIKFGASSHPYRYDLTGEGIVHFFFDNILLPDSFVNEAASHGFVKFRIEPRVDAPLGETINNTAAIYFDFNEPIFTNTTTHKLGVNFVTVRSWQPQIPGAEVSVSPNPFSETTVLTVQGLIKSDPVQLQIFDIHGKAVRTDESASGQFEIRKDNWPSGIYFFTLRQSGRTVGSGKLMVE